MYRSVIQQARQLSIKALHACDTSIGFVAGTHHFVDLWARDSLFATFGADRKQSKKTIETFLQYQRADGLVPYLILRSCQTIQKFFGYHTYHKILTPNYRSNQSGGIVPDGGLMAIIAMREYVEQTKDIKYLRNNFSSLERAIVWYWKQYRIDLIREWFLCEWADAVLKVGNTLYTNVLYWRALGDMAWMAKKLGKSKDARAYTIWQKKIEKLVQEKFWNGIFFADWIDYARHDYIATHANMMAIAWGLASKNQAQSILAYAKQYCWNGWTLESNYPKYEWWRIPLWHHAIGMADYHNRGCLWLQPGIWYAVALSKSGRKQEARTVLNAISVKIVESGDVYEVFEKNGKPIHRLFYTSEGPFAWTAGLYLWASEVIWKKKIIG